MRAERVQELKALVGALSSEPTEDLYWLVYEGGEQSEEVYCKRCAADKAQVRAEIGIDGGWAGDSDGLRECDSCGVRLRCWPTDYGAKEEIRVAQEHKPETPEDWWALRWAMEALVHADPMWELIERLLQQWGITEEGQDGT